MLSLWTTTNPTEEWGGCKSSLICSHPHDPEKRSNHLQTCKWIIALRDLLHPLITLFSPLSGSWMCWCATVWGSTVVWRPWLGCRWSRISGRASGTFIHTSTSFWELKDADRSRIQIFFFLTAPCLIAKFFCSSPHMGKIKRIAFQFTPYSWVKFEWRPASNLRRWLAVLGIIFTVRRSCFYWFSSAYSPLQFRHVTFFNILSHQFLLAELNTFYLKCVLWMPPEHYLVLLRLVFFVNVGGVAMREIYDFMEDPWVAELSWLAENVLGVVLIFFYFMTLRCFTCQQEVPQEARPAGVAGGSDHGDRVSNSGQVWPQHHHAAHPLLHPAVLVLRNPPHTNLDHVAVLYPVRSGLV